MEYPVSFSPHVAAFFRGINMTVQVDFSEAQTAEGLQALFEDFYQQHPLVKVQTKVPTVTQVVNTPDCLIGGFVVSNDGKRATLISCVDNLSKGAASQALQNINLVLGYEDTLGLLPTMPTTAHIIPGASS
jgi:N-acetyl-gamma-glutamylphosphate reductase